MAESGYSKPITEQQGNFSLDIGRGFSCLVSASDANVLAGHKWRVQIGKYGHAYAMASIDGKPTMMHRFLLSAPKGMWVDHIDGDGLNNTRENIRLCTPAQNMANRAHDRRNILGVKGVSTSKGKFRAYVTPNGKKIYLGTYETQAEASAAYKGAATILWGEFARV